MVRVILYDPIRVNTRAKLQRVPLSHSETLESLSHSPSIFVLRSSVLSCINLLFFFSRKYTSLITTILRTMVSPTALLMGAFVILPSLVAAVGQLGFSLGVKHNPVSYRISCVL